MATDRYSKMSELELREELLAKGLKVPTHAAIMKVENRRALFRRILRDHEETTTPRRRWALIPAIIGVTLVGVILVAFSFLVFWYLLPYWTEPGIIRF
jgi:hypothetical protein